MKKVIISSLVLSIGLMQYGLADNFTMGAYGSDWVTPNSSVSFDKQLISSLNSLQSSTGDTFKLVTYKTPGELGKALADGKVDFAYGKLESYLAAKQISPNVNIIALPLGKDKNDLTFSVYFITLKSNENINSWQDLENKTFIFKSKYSIAGFVYPVTSLLEQGKDFRKFFKNYSFGQENDHVISMLLAKKADAGVVWDEIYNHSAAKDKLKVIYTIKDIPNPPVISGSKLTAEQTKKIQADLGSLTASSLAPYYISGFTADVPAKLYADAYKKVDQLKAVNPSLVEQ